MGLTRTEFLSRLQMIRIMEPLAGEALEAREDQAHRGKLDEDSPHGRPWHTSFHASSFPGGSKLACPRKALYTLMDIPQDEPFSPKSRLMMEMGKTVEQFYVEGFYHMGILLSPPPWEPVQLGFTDPETWLTGNADAVILPPKLGRPHVWECKMKYAADIVRMKVGLQGPDEAHIVQAKTYVAFMRILGKQLWPKLPLIEDGTIFYASRDNPRDTAEFIVQYDPKFMEAGREQLKIWKTWFDEDVLPSQLGGQIPLDETAKGRKVSKRHPLGKTFRWTYQPCLWCDWQKTCKTDFKEEVLKLSKSNGVDYAKTLRKSYSPKAIRQAVYAAWEDDE